MVDPRIQKQAQILVNDSAKVKKGDKVIIAGNIAAKPLMFEIYKLCIKNGAIDVTTKFDSYEFGEYFFKNATTEQIKYFPKLDLDEIKQTDCYIRISAPTNTKALTGVDANKMSERIKVLQPISNFRVEHTRWVITRFPTDAQAQEADMSLSEYEDFVFGAINDIDWKKKFKEQEKLRLLMDKTDKVRIIGENTDLTLSIKGRKAENAGGDFNMPDGEVFTSSVENSANGFITYSFPALYLGREFHNVRLEFKNGKVMKATADKNEADLNKILDMDGGARFIGELGIGNNFAIRKFTKDILFDEKIGGTIHIALGKGYKETLSKNESALHWDMIKDLRANGCRPGEAFAEPDGSLNRRSGPEGELWFDNKLVQKNGKWLVGF